MAVRKDKITDAWTLGDLRDTFILTENAVTLSERGLNFLVKIETLSAELLAAIQKAIDAEDTHDKMIDDVKNGAIGLFAFVDALNAHGFPATPVLDLTPELDAELADVLASMAAAQERFEILQASTGRVQFGEGKDK